MFIRTITKQTRKNLDILGKLGFIKNFYMVSGSGIAIQIGHRISVDLDFFTANEFEPKQLKDVLSSL